VRENNNQPFDTGVVDDKKWKNQLKVNMQKRKHRIGTELIEKSFTCVSIASKFVGGLSDDSKVWIWPSTVPLGEESAAHFPETRT